MRRLPITNTAVVTVLITQIAWAAKEKYVCRLGPGTGDVPCVVYLVPVDYAQPLIEYRSNAVVDLPPGSYDIRAGANGLALPFNTVLTVDAEPVPSGHRTILIMGPGGRVSVTEKFAGVHGAAQVISLSTGRIDTVFRDRESTLPFPAGQVIGVATERPGKISGISGVLSLSVSDIVTMGSRHQPADGRGDLIFSARFGADNVDAGRNIQDFWMSEEDHPDRIYRPRASTEMARTSFYAFFYDVPAGKYIAHLKSRRWHLRSSRVTVVSKITSLDDQHVLELAPSVKVTFKVAPILKGRVRKASAFRCRDYSPSDPGWPLLDECAKVASTSGTADDVTLPGLDPGPVFVEGEIDGHREGQGLNLKIAEESKITLSFQPLRILGTVERGAIPVRARLDFEHLDSETRQAACESDGDGHFQTELWTPGGYAVWISPEEPAGSNRIRRLLRITEEAVQKLDFVIPETVVQVRVTDAESGQPIASADVSTVKGQDQMTDATGIVEFRGLSPGAIRLAVSADAYVSSNRVVTIAESSDRQTFDVALNRTRQELNFQVLLPSGAPAANARGYLGSDGDPLNGIGVPVQCDAAGTCHLDSRPQPGTVLFLYDPAAAVTPIDSETALNLGQVVLRSRGGPTEIVVTRGPDRNVNRVLAEATVDGIRIPNGVLRSFGNGDIATLPTFPKIVLATLPAGALSINLFSISSENGVPVLRQIGGPIQSDNSRPATLDFRVP